MKITRGAAALAIGTAIVVGLMSGQAGAAGGSSLVATEAGQFVSSLVMIEQGESLRFVQAEPARIHDLTSMARDAERRPLFASARAMAVGQTSMVAGVEQLEPGRYDFYCSLHPSMKGTLIVSAPVSIS